MDRIAWPTAAVNVIALLVLGAVLIWAPAKSVEALMGVVGLAGGSLLKGLFHGRQAEPSDSDRPTDPGSGPRSIA